MLKTNNNPNLIFIHANGFPPNSYSQLFKNFKNDFRINNFILRPLWDKKENFKIVKDWTIFHNDFIKSLNNIDDVIGMGHSIGGNIILRSALSHPNKFSKLILLDPTLFIPKIILGWKIFSKLGLQKKIHPWINSTLTRKMIYNNDDEIFKSYRRKKVFSKIKDENLKIYIRSITKESGGKLHITYPKDWEYQIYKTGLIADMFIWENVKYLDIPCLIIRAENSNAFLDSSEKKIRSLNPKIKFIKLKESTHLFPLEFPDKTFDIIQNFLLV